MMGVNPKGRNWGSLVNWDDLGKFYAGVTVSWTVILYAGIAWLILNRNLPFIRIRNLPLAIAAVSFLHVYLVKILLAYTTNGHFRCAAEFWIMSIYLPFGIALFQANLLQLKSISEEQQKLVARHESLSHPGIANSLWARWVRLPSVRKSYVVIGFFMALQLVITGALYGSTPTLQGDWSSFGNVSHRKGQALCRKSLEWIASAFWQLAWSWIVGPYIIYSIRNIHDVHYWRLQVILSVASGLPGTPLWLAAVYSTGFKHVNRWWVPPMWLAPGIIVMQFVTVFFPMYEAWTSRRRMRTTLAIIKDWDDRRRTNSDEHLVQESSKRTSIDKSLITNSTTSSRGRRDIHSIASLEKAIAINPIPLLQFAATKDFTAENILFLMHLRRWHYAWASAPQVKGTIPDEARTQLFNMGVEIYITSVGDRTTDFPINIASRLKQELDALFGPAVPHGRYLKNNDPDPFSKPIMRPILPETNHSSNSSDTLYEKAVVSVPTLETTTKFKEEGLFEPHPCVAPLGKARATIRAGFDKHVFDEAEKSIKYLVLTNTWQKFVRTGEEDYRDREIAAQ